MHPFERGTLRLQELDADPFKNMKISDCCILDSIAERSLCPRCGKSRKYFCYACFVPVVELIGKVPQVKLPIKIDVIKHRREMDGKSTAAHAAILAPDDVRIFTYPEIPEYSSDENVVLVYPSQNSSSVGEYFRNRPKNGSKSITRAIFIDSTWNQSNGIYKDDRLRSLPTVVLRQKISQFWRHQKGSPRWYLATIEAIHQLLIEIDCAENTIETRGAYNAISDDIDITGYDGKYDDILFFFRFMYAKIHTLYDHDKLLSYKRRLL